MISDCGEPKHFKKMTRRAGHLYRVARLVSLLKCLIVSVVLGVPLVGATQQFSALWGHRGELWDPSVLRDWSQAGYRYGLSIPHMEKAGRQNIKVDYGAQGDGKTDDTEAFAQALADGGTIYIPGGVYIIRRPIFFSRNHTVLTGAGPDATVLSIPISLTDVAPRSDPYQASRSLYYSREGFVDTNDRPLKNLGIQDLSIRFPDTPQAKHQNEQGYNGIEWSQVSHGWIKNVEITNADNGVLLRDSQNLTVDSMVLNGRGGHYGVRLMNTHESLVTDFMIVADSYHDLSVTQGSSGNVFSNGWGTEIAFDHHSHASDPAPRDNLFSNIVSKFDRNPWYSGGSIDDIASEYGVDETFWNVRHGQDEPFRNVPGFNDASNGPLSPGLIYVGAADEWTTQSPAAHVEAIDPAQLCPQDLHRAQRGIGMCAVRTAQIPSLLNLPMLGIGSVMRPRFAVVIAVRQLFTSHLVIGRS